MDVHGWAHAGSVYEHTFNEHGTVVWRVIDEPTKGRSAQEKEYAAVKIADAIHAVPSSQSQGTGSPWC